MTDREKIEGNLEENNRLEKNLKHKFRRVFLAEDFEWSYFSAEVDEEKIIF